MLKPGGTLSLAVGSLSGEAAIGGGVTGASFAAASFPVGRPIRGEPGGSGAAAGADAGGGLAAGGAAAGGFGGCCAAAPSVRAPNRAPASQRLRGANKSLFMDVLPGGSPLSPFPLRHA